MRLHFALRGFETCKWSGRILKSKCVRMTVLLYFQVLKFYQSFKLKTQCFV